MSNMLTLEQMVDFYGREAFPIPEERIRRVMRKGGEDEVLGHLLRACNDYAAGHGEAAAAYLEDLRTRTGTLALPIIAMLIWFYRSRGQGTKAARLALAFAEDAASCKQHALAVEAVAAAFLLDQEADFALTRNPEELVRAAQVYEQAAAVLAPQMPAAPASSTDGRRRIALITGNLVDHVVAYSRRTLELARLANPKRYDVRVYSTENLTARLAPRFPFGLENEGSEQRAAATLEALRACRIPVYLAPRDRDALETARLVIGQLCADGIEMALFQTGMASPIDWLVARLAPIAVKAGIHIGCSPFNKGFDLFVFDNPENIRREQDWWKPEMGERIHLTSGVDLEAIRKAPPVARRELGIPSDATVVGVLSNHLERRLEGAYRALLIRTLQRHPHVYLLGVGIPPTPAKQQVFQKAGVGERVLFPGPVSQPASALKLFDIYAAEFPVGGSQSVKEAIACGLPTVAMKWSEAHAESAAAHIVGPPFAIGEPDAEAYEALLDCWIQNAAERKRVGKALQARAARHYSLAHYAHNLFDRLEKRLAEKQPRPPPPADENAAERLMD